MKFVAVLGSTLASMFISIAAQAVVLPDGSFAPDRCGAQTGLVGHVQSVCIGQVQGVQGEAIEFRLADKSTRVYKVIDQQNLMVAMLSGNTKSVLFLAGANGEKMTMKVIMNPAHEITSVQGVIDDVGYFVPEFHQMVVVQ